MDKNKAIKVLTKDQRFKKHFLIGLTLLTLTTGWGGAALMLGCFPEHYVRWFPYIPSFFYIWGMIFITLFQQNAGRKLTLLFLGMKVAKMLLFVAIIGLYVVLVDEKNLDFAMTFLIFYLIYLLFETVFFWSYERKNKVAGTSETKS